MGSDHRKIIPAATGDRRRGHVVMTFPHKLAEWNTQLQSVADHVRDCNPDALPLVPVVDFLAKVVNVDPQSAAENMRRLEVAELRTADARHSVDFASVNWFGTLHAFSTNQAACVRVLWEAWENRTPILAESTIQDAAGVESELRHVFRNNPAWNTMIVSPSKGRYRLADPIS